MRRRVLVTSLLLTTSLAGCAALRQNMRGQELSYRGAWYCKSGPCEAGEMSKSTTGTREDTTMINEVVLAPKAGLAFTAAAPFDALTATVRDCKGQSAEVPSADIVQPGAHGIGDADARESWLVWLDPASLSGLDRSKGCVWKVEASATWSDGATYSLTAGIEIGG
jgi:hypothetical protein